MYRALATVARDDRRVPVIEVFGDWHRLDKLAPKLLAAHPSRKLIAMFAVRAVTSRRIDEIAAGSPSR